MRSGVMITLAYHQHADDETDDGLLYQLRKHFPAEWLERRHNGFLVYEFEEMLTELRAGTEKGIA